MAVNGYAVLRGLFCATSWAFLNLLTILDCRQKFLCVTEAKLCRPLPGCQAPNCNMLLKALLATAEELCLISAHGGDASA